MSQKRKRTAAVKLETEDNHAETISMDSQESKKKKKLKLEPDDEVAISELSVDNAEDSLENGTCDDGSVEEPDDIELKWDPAEMKMLLENIRQNVPKTDTQKCWTTLEKLDWEKIKFGDHDAKECKACAQTILKKIRKYRTLTEILSDAFEWAENPWKSLTTKRVTHPNLPKKPMSSYMRYFSEKRSKIQAQNPDISMAELTKILAQKFNKLSDKKKEKYKTSYEKDLIEYRQKIKQFRQEHPEIYLEKRRTKEPQIGPVKPRTPFEMYRLHKLKKMTDPEEISTFSDQIRDIWNNLTDKRRYKFIRKSLKDQERYKTELEEFLKECPEDYKPPKLRPLLNKNEFELKLKFEGMPEKPPNSGYMLFSQIMLKELKDVPAREKMVLIAKRWKEMTDQERASYNEDAQSMTNEYIVKFDEFLQDLPEDEKERIMLDQKFKFPTEKRLAIKNNIDNTAFIAYQMEELPKMQKKHPKKTKQEIMEIINNEWKSMSTEHKSKYTSLAESIQEYIPHKGPVLKKRRKGAYDEMETEFAKIIGFKRPKPTGYVQFCHRILSQQTDLETKERMKYASEQWKQIPTDLKQQFSKIGKERYRQYMTLLQRFKESGEVPSESEIEQFKKEMEFCNQIVLEMEDTKLKKAKKNKAKDVEIKEEEDVANSEKQLAPTLDSTDQPAIEDQSPVNPDVKNETNPPPTANGTNGSWSNILYQDSESSMSDLEEKP